MELTESFIRDIVMPEVESTGGATVLVSPYGMPPALLRMDKYQPPTWVVGVGVEPIYVSPTLRDCVEAIASSANFVLGTFDLNAWSALGFWVDGDGMLVIEPVETYTSHEMALVRAREMDQIAIYAMHTGELEWLPARDAGALVPVADR